MSSGNAMKFGTTEQAGLTIVPPATLRVGDLSASEIGHVICGSVTIDVGNVTAMGVASASASIIGLTANHFILLHPTTWSAADVLVSLKAAACTTDTLTVTASNASAVTSVDPASRTYGFWAFKPV